MRKKIVGVISFAATIAVMILVLKIVNWLPTLFEKGVMARYSSIEEVREKLNIKELYVPSYFPQSFSWPPSEIFAQNKPYAAVVMEFKQRERGDIALIISQAASEDFVPDQKINIVRVKEKAKYSLTGREAVLVVGICKNEQPCSRIAWDQGKYSLHVIMRSPPFELIKIAESMVR